MFAGFRLGQNLVEMNPTGLPHLFNHSQDQKNNQKTKKNFTTTFQKNHEKTIKTMFRASTPILAQGFICFAMVLYVSRCGYASAMFSLLASFRQQETSLSIFSSFEQVFSSF